MDFHLGSEDPAILQLHNWDPSETRIVLSDFREAFISPTRETLLLHSHGREALLLPLGKGDYCFSLLIDLFCILFTIVCVSDWLITCSNMCICFVTRRRVPFWWC